MSIHELHWARLSYPHVFDARPITRNGQETGLPRFGANLILPEGWNPQEIQNAVHASLVAKWPKPEQRPMFSGQVNGDPRAWSNKIPGQARTPLVWGPAEFPDDASCANRWVIITAAKFDSPPALIERINGANLSLVRVEQVGTLLDNGKAKPHMRNVPLDSSDAFSKIYPGAEVHASIGIYAFDMSVNNRGVTAGLNILCWSGRPADRFDGKPSVSSSFQGISDAAPPPPVPSSAPQPPAPAPGYPAQPQYQAPQPPAPGYPAQPQYQAPQPPAPGYPAQPGYQAPQPPASGYPAQPGYPASGYPAQPQYQAPQPPAQGYPAQPSGGLYD